MQIPRLERLIYIIINPQKKKKLCQISTYQRDEVSENNQAILTTRKGVDLFLTFMPQWDILKCLG
jgi:hypothetical protein